MPESKNLMKEVLPKQGLLYQEDMPTVVLCKPKILPLKSVTLEKLEKMQKEAQDTVRQQEKETSLNDDMFAGI
jgi:BBSome-interacting protein 1